MGKPTANERKQLRAALQRVLLSFWGHTERQVVMKRRPDGTWKDTQSESVLDDVANFRLVLEEIEKAYR